MHDHCTTKISTHFSNVETAAWAVPKLFLSDVKNSWSLELRPTDKDAWQTNRGGFVLEPEQIVPVGKELFAGVQALAEEVKKSNENRGERCAMPSARAARRARGCARGH